MRHITIIVTLFLSVTLIGCGRSNNLPKLYEVQITVMQEGKPLEGASVSLQAAEGTPYVIGGATDGSGVAVMYANGQYRGAPEGEYKVCVEKSVLESSPPEPTPHTPEHDKWLRELERNPPGAWRYTEEQYGRAETTPLTLSVKGKTQASVEAGKAIKVRIN